MLTHPTAESTNHRVIVDLSWPHGRSVNDKVCKNSYLSSVFKLILFTVNDISEHVQKLKGNCLLYKIDLQRAFLHLKLDPKDINFAGLMYLENYYVDTAVCQPADCVQPWRSGDKLLLLQYMYQTICSTPH